MKPIGIVSIPLSQTPSADLPFQHLMGAAGNNTGNMLFTNAVWSQIEGPKIRQSFLFDPEEINTTCRALVFPAANWFGAHLDFAEFADRVQQLDIPVILVGLGAQDPDYSGELNVPEGTVRFVRAVSERCHSISVRGEYTKQKLADYGIQNVEVTGCPSLYPADTAQTDELLMRSAENISGAVLLHSTRYWSDKAFIDTPSLHRELFRLAYQTGTDLLFQSEPEEISLLVDAKEKPAVDDRLKSALQRIYQADDWSDLEAFIQCNGQVFFDLPSWRNALMSYSCAFGTRLHATIMALNSGLPAVLACHDSRTREMSEFAGIPSVEGAPDLADLERIAAIVAEVDFGHFVAVRKENRDKYKQFLSHNDLSPTIIAKN